VTVTTADVVIVGGGVVGTSIAYHLTQRMPSLRIVLLDQAAGLGMGATAKATGGIRHQFASEINVRLTQRSVAEFLHFAEITGVDPEWEPCGYLFVTTKDATVRTLAASAAMQQRLGVSTGMLDPEGIARRFPVLRADDLAGGSFCGADGAANPYAVTSGYGQRARAGGVVFRLGEAVEAIEVAGGRVTGVRTNVDRISAPCVVGAAGSATAELARTVGVVLPITSYRRQVAVGEPIDELPVEIPFVIDLDTGWYLHRQRDGTLLMGGTDAETRPGTAEIVDWDLVATAAEAGTHRIPLLKRTAVRRAYVGLRDLTPDLHAIVGPVTSPAGFICAAGFSGHGFMHAPAVGQIVAALVLDGAVADLDIAPLSPQRFDAPVTRERVAF
jgi:sarcosine oxidase subunit beta